jgi:predicted Zn-dependent protease
MRKYLFITLCAASMLCRAEGLPDLGDISAATVSPQQEREIGLQSMADIRADPSYLDDVEISDYLNQLGHQLASNSSEPGQEFEFFVINSNAINAFALPGGYIGVYTGLILIAQSESELASVLGHEIAHVTQHHLARMIAGQKVDTLASMAAVAIAILAARSNPDASQAVMAGAQGGAIQRQLNFSRANEQEADRHGLITLQKAGFDVHAMPAFLERMQKATRLLEGNIPSYFRTHPITTDRIADIANRVQDAPYKLVADSLNFHLVRARLQAMQKEPQEAVSFFTRALGEQRYGNQIAQRYGLVLTLLRNGQTERAAQEFAPLQAQVTQNAMIATLAGKIMQTAGSDKDITGFYRSATQNFPQHRALTYDYAELLLKAKSYDDALKLLAEQTISHPTDPLLYELQARTYAAQGKHRDEHHALAHSYALRGNLHGAIAQLELAKQGDGDYYELSAIESELRKMRETAAAHVQKN